MKSPVTIWIVDDHQVVANGIAALFISDSRYAVRVFYNKESVLAALGNAALPDVLITDYNMPGMEASAYFSSIQQQCSNVKIIVLSMHDSPRIVQDAVRSGVSAFVLKQNPEQELMRAVELVLSGESFFSAELMKSMARLQQEQEEWQLTNREKEILRLLAKAYSTKDIARELYISERTVETHRKHLLRKTGTNNITALLRTAKAHLDF